MQRRQEAPSRLDASRVPRVSLETRRWIAGSLSALLLYAAAGGCRDNPTQPPEPDPNEVRATIGPAGGTLVSKDGNVTLTFPAGALASARELTIRPIVAGALGREFAGVQAARAYELGPNGLALVTPATVTLRTSDRAVQPDGSLRLVPHILLTSKNGVVERLDDLEIVMSGDSVLARGRLAHFSPLVEQQTQLPIGTFEITGIPDRLELGLVATVRAQATIPVLSLASAEYHDDTPDSPLRTAFPVMALLEADAGVYRRSIAYECESTGEGLFRAHIAIVTAGTQNGDVAPWLRGATLRGNVRRQTRCDPPAIFALTVEREGPDGAGRVTSETNPPRTPPDIFCPGNCNGNFERGTLVGLRAVPNPGFRFAGWGGACADSGTDPLAPVVVDTNRTCIARFAAIPRYTLTVRTSGEGGGTISMFPAGTDCGTDCAQYLEGTTVLVSADHDGNSVFGGWSGDCSGESSINVVMNANKTCSARFDKVKRTLTVERSGAGSGTVATSPTGGGIACGNDCTEQYPHGTVVTLVATPDENSVFAGWSGACSGSGAAVVEMTADMACTARFERKPRTLAVTSTPSDGGSVGSTPAGIACGNDCTEQYPHGTAVALVATPAEGWDFVAWTGACPGGSATTTVVMDADKSCAAQFKKKTRTLAVTVTGEGAGSVGSFPLGITCGLGGTDCDEGYPHGTVVTLAAGAGDGSVFAGWSGACATAGTGLTATVTMDADKTCTARFDRVRFALRVAKDGDGHGSVASAPAGIACADGGGDCQEQYLPGTDVTLTATAAAGSRFTGWAGTGCAGSAAAVTVTMAADRLCTATFVLIRHTLIVQRTGTGAGRVSSDPAAIDCGTTCIADLLEGARLELSAIADEDSYFAGWEGECTVESSPTTRVTMDGDRTCGARFELLAARTLRVAISPAGGGSVTSLDGGTFAIACPGSACEALFAPGASVTLLAQEAEGWDFVEWSGDCSGTDPRATVVMTTNRGCTAHFKREPARRLIVTKTGAGTGRVTGTPAGDPGAIDCGQLCRVVYATNTVVTLTAVPDDNSVFAGWSGECSGASATTEVLVEQADYTCTARFDPKPRTLTVRTAGTGTGSVASAPAGIACGNDCTEPYPHGTTVRLTATADEGSAFVGWAGGDCIGTSASTSVLMDADRACTALFTSTKYSLAVEPTGTGKGGVTSAPPGIACGDAGQDCDERYFEGTTVTLTARPVASSEFVRWGGACAGTAVTAAVFMNADKQCTAEFRAGVDSVILYKTGSGKGTVTSDPAGINCGPDCTFQAEGWATGTVVTLTATPAPESKFSGWSGDCVPNGTTATVALDGKNKACTATFDARHTLTVQRAGLGNGRVTSTAPAGGILCGNDCEEQYDHGTVVSLVAEPIGIASFFAGWSGACSGTGPATVTMDANKTCTAQFDLYPPKTLTVTPTGSGSGTVGSFPVGIACGQFCASPFAHGSRVDLTATPSTGSKFVTWGNACAGDGAKLFASVTMDDHKTCSAQFDLLSYMLHVTTAGPGKGTVTSDPEGITCGEFWVLCDHAYDYRTSVTLTAAPDAKSVFAGWSGDCSGSEGPTTVLMGSERTCTATFGVALRTLEVAKGGDGTGRVVSDPGIDCGNDCIEKYPHGTRVVLTAMKHEGSDFTGWTGDCVGTAEATPVDMDANKACTALFKRVSYELKVVKTGTGAGGVISLPLPGIDCGQDCDERFAPGTTVRLEAEPGLGMRFVGWGGACSGSDRSATVVMSEDRTCTAEFEQQFFTLLVTRTGQGTGTVTSDPVGIACGQDCDELYPGGLRVSLTPVPDAGSKFGAWSGDCAGAGASAVDMDRNKACAARFDRDVFPLSVSILLSPPGSGSVTSTPPGIDCVAGFPSDCTEEYLRNTQVTLTAEATRGFYFVGWTGACEGTSPVVTVTMDAARGCVAQFAAMPVLTVTKSGSGGGQVTSTPAGIACGNDCDEPYAPGTVVKLTPKADANSFFVTWSGACAGTGEPTVTMDASKTCDAQFDKLALRKLTVTKSGDGALAGRVTGTPAGADATIDCGAVCAASFAPGARVTLTAAPGTTPGFAGWSGTAPGCTGGNSSVTITLGDADVTCDARFNRLFTATVTLTGTGTGRVVNDRGTIDCPGDCTEPYGDFDILFLQAIPGPNSTFGGWTGGCFGSGTLATAPMQSNITCTANFVSTVGMSLRPRSSVPFADHVDAATLGVGSFLLALGTDGSGTLTSINFANPASPVVTATVPNFCTGAQSLFMTSTTNNFYLATRPDSPLGCPNRLPPTTMSPVNFGFLPRGGAPLPSTGAYAVTDFSNGRLRINGFAVPIDITLSTTGKVCPAEVAVTSASYLVVTREGVPGTPTEACGPRGKLIIVNRSTNQVTSTTEIGTSPRGIAVAQDRSAAYVADETEDRVYVLNPSTGALLGTIPTGDGPTSVSVFTDGTHIVVNNRNSNQIQILDARTGAAVVTTGSNGVAPTKVFLTADGRTVAVVNYGADSGGGNATFFEPVFATGGTMSASAVRR